MVMATAYFGISLASRFYRKILAGREIWLSDLAYSNDENEIVYGLGRVATVIDDVSRAWSNRNDADLVNKLAKRVTQRPKN